MPEKADDPKKPPESVNAGADSLSTNQTPGPGGTNPFDEGPGGATGGTGGVNPSAPTSGTEAWGLGPKEAEASHSRNENVSFHCSDVHPDCLWEAHGRNEEEIRSQTEQHARERHNVREIGDDTWKKIRKLIRRREVA